MPSCTLSHPLPAGKKMYITLASDSSGLVSVHLSLDGKERKCSDPFLKAAAIRIKEYLQGKRREFKVKISPSALEWATPFQREVWRTTSRIPYGETRTYGQIAVDIGRPKSARAVGNALGKNPLPLIIPCHRVVSSSGLGGFSGGGTEIKVFLLAVEGREKL